MIRIVARSRRRVRSTKRDLPVGTKRVLEHDLGFASFERVQATSGCYASSYAQFTAVLTERPSTGPVRFNCGDMRAEQETTRALYFFRPDDRIEGVWRRPNSYDVLLFSPDYVEHFLNQELGGRSMPVEPLLRQSPSVTVVWLWERLARLLPCTDDLARMQSELIGCMLVALMAMPNAELARPAPMVSASELSNVLRYIQDNLGAQLTISELARTANLSAFHFGRVFKRSTGLPVHKFIMEQRLMHARVLLETTSQPISQIALDAGFASQSHLNTAFRRRFQTTPRSWRSSHRSSAGFVPRMDRQG